MSVLRGLFGRMVRRSGRAAGPFDDLDRGDDGRGSRKEAKPADERRGCEVLPQPRDTAAIGALLGDGNLPEALRLADAWVAQEPNAGDAHFWRHEVLAGWGRHREARKALELAASMQCETVAFLSSMGWSRLRAGCVVDSSAWFAKALERDPTNLDALVGRAAVERASGRSIAAMSALRDLSARFPDKSALSILCAQWEMAEGDVESAERRLREEILRRPAGIDARRVLASMLYSADRSEECIRELQAAYGLELTQGFEGAYEDLAIALCGSGRYQEGYEILIRHLPELASPRGHRQLAVAMLALGFADEAWLQMEYRWFEGPQSGLRPTYTIPCWNGQELRGRTILLHPEQGIGDTIQFVRYAPLLKALGAHVVMRPLIGMERLSRLFIGVDDVIDGEEAAARSDFYATLMSLPGVFRMNEKTIPPPIAIREADGSPSLVEELAGARAGIVRVGIVWAGRPDHTRDRYRSLSFDALTPLFEVEGVEWISLQKGVSAAEVDRIQTSISLRAIGPKLDDLVDAAAALRALDLLIAVDTGIAHLAGTLGLPVWVLVAEPADARWLVARNDTPWYPTMRLFRQRAPGQWRPVIVEMAEALGGALRRIRAGSDARVVFSMGAQAAGRAIERRQDDLAVTHLARVARTPVGLLQYDPDDGVRGRSIEHYGEFRDLERRMIDVLVRSGDRCVEVGPAYGWRTMGLARAVGEDGEVWACESRKTFARMLRNNLAANAVENVTVVTRAVGSIHASGGGGDTIDDLRLERLDCVILNDGVDTSACIEGASDTLWRCRPWLMLAQEDDAALAALAARVREFGYRTWRMETPLFNPDNFNRRTDDIFGGRTALTLIALPEESALPEPGPGCVELA